MQHQPLWVLSWSGIALLAVFIIVAWQAINHRRGRPVVLVICGLLLMGGLLSYGLHHVRAVDASSATIVAVVDSSPPDESLEGTPQQPDWVGKRQQKVNGEFIFTVTAGPYATEPECEKQLTQELRKRVDAFIDNFLDAPGAGRRVDLEMALIHDRMVKQQSLETVQASFGPMKNLHALVHVDRPMQDLIRQRHQVALRQARLGYAAGAFGLLLVLLATAFGYLKLDTLTKGYYSGRLKLAATAVILTAAAATALVVRQVDPAANWPLKLPFQQSPQLVESTI